MSSESIHLLDLNADNVTSGGTVVKNLPANAEDARDTGSISSREDPLEQEMATHFRLLAWRIPQTGAWQATVHEVLELDTTEET